jgi:hypothetical protein
MILLYIPTIKRLKPRNIYIFSPFSNPIQMASNSPVWQRKFSSSSSLPFFTPHFTDTENVENYGTGWKKA